MHEGRATAAAGTVFFSRFRFESGSGRLWRDDDEVPLRPKPASVLSHLLARPGDVVSKRELLEAVWPDGFVGDAVLTVCVNQLRQVLGDDSRHPSFIATSHRRGYRFVAPVSSMPQAPAAAGRRALPFVGREAELAILDGCWQQARTGRGRMVFVAAQAGVGKTALVDVFVDRLRDGDRVLIGRGQCAEQFGEGEAYLPVLDALSGLGRGPDGHIVREVLRSAAPTWLLQLPGLVEPADLERLRVRTVGTSSERMLREVANALEVLTAERPLVLVLEDLHQSDRSTTELLAYLARRRDPARLLIVGTYRPADVVSRSHPLSQVVRDLRAHRQCEFLPLELLSRPAVGAYLGHCLAPGRPSEALITDVHQRTDGNALFVTTMVDHLIHRGLLTDADGETVSRERLDRLGIPDSVGQFIERQLDELAAPDRHLIEVAAAVGVYFSAEAVLAGARHDRPDLQATEVEHRCSGLARNSGLLAERDLVDWPDGTVTAYYRFHHALYQEVLYGHLPPARRVAVHRRIGERLASGYGSRAGEIAAELAMHFERGHDFEQAIQYLIRAAETALQRAAHQETLDYATRGLQLLERTEAIAERSAVELRLRMMQVVALVTLQGRGAPAVEVAYQQARAVCAENDDPAVLGPVLYGLWNVASGRGRMNEAAALTSELFGLARQHADPILELQAHHTAGFNDLQAGRPVTAMAHVERSLALYDRAAHRYLALVYGSDPAVACHTWAAVASWLLGYPERARQHARDACGLARDLGSPNDIFLATIRATYVHVLRHDIDRVREHVDHLLGVHRQYGLTRTIHHVKVIDGWAAAQQGEPAATISPTTGPADLATYSTIDPFIAWLRAETLALRGEVVAALETASDALDTARRIRNVASESELVRLRGELLLRVQPSASTDTVSDAESAFLEALTIARRQQAKSFELRAATSLTRLWQSRGQLQQARELLTEIYGWFTEGHDTHDLQEAATLLAELE